jgi:hypothetical protein
LIFFFSSPSLRFWTSALPPCRTRWRAPSTRPGGGGRSYRFSPLSDFLRAAGAFLSRANCLPPGAKRRSVDGCACSRVRSWAAAAQLQARRVRRALPAKFQEAAAASAVAGCRRRTRRRGDARGRGAQLHVRDQHVQRGRGRQRRDKAPAAAVPDAEANAPNSSSPSAVLPHCRGRSAWPSVCCARSRSKNASGELTIKLEHEELELITAHDQAAAGSSIETYQMRTKVECKSFMSGL